jgi:hypothetical protein
LQQPLHALISVQGHHGNSPFVCLKGEVASCFFDPLAGGWGSELQSGIFFFLWERYHSKPKIQSRSATNLKPT